MLTAADIPIQEADVQAIRLITFLITLVKYLYLQYQEQQYTMQRI